MPPSHGALFDNFPAQSSHPHGGSLYDQGFPIQELADTHGKLFDQFAKPRTPDQRHGARFDDFGWQDMPAMHGHLFDSDFKLPAALDGSDRHATWFDAFRGGAQLRYRSDGADYEGVVIDCGQEFATVLSTEGGRHEVLLSQILQWRDAPAADLGPTDVKPTAQPGNTDTSVVGGPQGERPSGESHHAMGGGSREDGPQPGWETAVIALKSLPYLDVDVVKSATAIVKHGPLIGHVSIPAHARASAPSFTQLGFHCKNCGPPAHGGNFPIYKGESRGHACDTCGNPLEGRGSRTKVGKTVDSTETTVQSQDLEGDTRNAYCPKCEHVCRKAANGRCPTCGGKVTVRKTDDELDGIAKQLRDLSEAA